MVKVADLLRLWGKTARDETGQVVATHPLLCHLIDVGAVAEALWRDCLTAGIRADMAQRLGTAPNLLGPTLAFWASLHDLGKACPSFQRRYPERIPELRALGLSFPANPASSPPYHGQVTGRTLRSILEKMGTPGALANTVNQSLAGHHGQWPTPKALFSISPKRVGSGQWDVYREAIVQNMRALFPPDLSLPDPDDFTCAAVGAWFSGLVSVADWMGSMTEFFPPAPDTRDLATYLLAARTQAARTLAVLQWDRWVAPSKPATFGQLFPGWSPQIMQQAAIEARVWDRPGLVILEAPTGSGKTETALYLADQWAHACQQRGLYIAMPTMATSNQMHTRAREMLERRHGEDIETLLVHSQARWRQEPQTITVDHEGDRSQSYDAMRWFLPRKRSLLAPLGVGTVDQTFLSVLQTRHFFVRLFGLAYKTIIFDEVHAYDAYMSTIFCRLLSWLRQLGCAVVILSATLPESTRREMLAAYGGEPAEPPESVPYPALTWCCDDAVGYQPLPPPPDHTVRLEWLSKEPDAVCDALARAMCDGGCAAVICNTVGHAQELYRALEERRLVPETDLILFHARYPYWRREEIEKQVLDRFGREGDRPRASIVVATQVIEQSLDLDFDVMFSDMAPIDLLIQRAGRLHRHAREGRPQALTNPCLHILCEPLDGPTPTFAKSRIYETYVMLRSWLALRDRDLLSLPSELQALIETVYGKLASPLADDPIVSDRIEAARAKMDKNIRGDTYDAKIRLIPEPTDESALCFQGQDLADEDNAVHEALKALTRSGGPSITLVCLHQTEHGLVLDPCERREIDLGQPPDTELTRELVKHSVSVSLYYVVKHFAEQEAPAGWRRHPLLRYDRPAIFIDGRRPLEGTSHTLILSEKLGLELFKEEA